MIDHLAVITDVQDMLYHLASTMNVVWGIEDIENLRNSLPIILKDYCSILRAEVKAMTEELNVQGND